MGLKFLLQNNSFLQLLLCYENLQNQYAKGKYWGTEVFCISM